MLQNNTLTEHEITANKHGVLDLYYSVKAKIEKHADNVVATGSDDFTLLVTEDEFNAIYMVLTDKHEKPAKDIELVYMGRALYFKAPKKQTDYTHTRISKPYLKKLAKLAKKNKRSAMAQLEHLIDQAEAKQ